MRKLGKFLVGMAFTAGMLISSVVPPLSVEARTELVNVALLEGVTATSEQGANSGYPVSNVIDGKDTPEGSEKISWQTTGKWPSTAVIALDRGRTVSKVVVKLGEKGDNSTGRTALVTIKYAQNGVTSNLIDIGSYRMTVDSDYEFSLETPVSATHIYVELSAPQNSDGSTGGFWPSVEEIEIYEEQEVVLSHKNNIAYQADITVSTPDKVHGSEGMANLVDKNDGSLCKFYKDQMTSEQTITLTYESVRVMDAFRIAFEHVTSDEYNYTFDYSIFAKNGDGTYDTIVEHAIGNRTDKWFQEYPIEEKAYSEVKLVMHSCTTKNGFGWPAIAEFEVYGDEALVEDEDNIALRRPVHVSSGKNQAGNIVDGSKNSVWRGDYYPAYADIDLGKNYYLDTVEVFTPENGYSQYSIYTSMNGRDFDKLAEKNTTESSSLEIGELYQAEGKEARYVRVYVEYNSAETAAVLHDVRVTGIESGTEVQERQEINIPKFEDSAYNVTVTEADTYNEVYGIIERRLGENYKSWFTLELAPNPNGTGYDYFELSSQDGKIFVKGNDGVSLATGINHFLKYYCNVNISQVGDQVTMPASMPVIDGTVHKETKAEIRYSYNYCTFSYSMAFWGEKEWRDELDWLALNGVNVVLDVTAQEEVWRRFLGELGYSHEEIKDFIAGPAYYAWAYMANLSGFGGPVHDSWFEERTELARKNQLIMRKLGMQPVLQGYSGMVPTDIKDHDANAPIIEQGNWCSFQRPSMLVTTSDKFDEYAAKFYACQKEVYGDVSDYYATDPFHEGGNTGGMNSGDIAREVLVSMLNADAESIWIIQAWENNPKTALLNGLDQIENGAKHALVLDLYAEKEPHNGETGNSYGDTDEFDDTPWLFCMLNNFGGRLGLHGHLDNLAKNVPAALNTKEHIAGIGITPEASVNNPVLYDFFFETIWQDDATQTAQEIDLGQWLEKYAERRYGAASESANQAWDILKNTVYKSSLNNLGQGAPESVVNARPALSIKAASTWGNAVVSYDKVQLEEAAKLLLKDYDILKNSEGYLYDVATVLQQILSNSAQEYHNKMTAAYNAGDVAKFEEYAAVFMAIIDDMEKVTATSEYYLLGRWVEQAKALADNADDFTKELYELNAKALVTTWGAYNQAESGKLKDYSNRQWSGLIGDFYKVRWQRWIDARISEMKGESYESNINWFQWEWAWVRSNTEYTTNPTPQDLDVLGVKILKNYTSANPAADPSRDIDPTTMTVYAENYEPNNATEGDPNYVLDGDNTTWWHTKFADTSRDTQYLIFTFDKVTKIDSMRFQQRQGGVNGVVKKYNLYIKANENDAEWTQVIANGTLASDNAWQKVSFDAVNAKQVKFQVADASSNNSNKFAAAAEVRFTEAKSYVDSKCVSYYSFDDIENGVVKDEWGNRNGQLVGNAMTAEGKQGKALSVTQALQGVELEGTNTLTDNWTVAFWVKKDSGLSGEVRGLQNNDASNLYGCVVGRNGNNIAFRVGDIYQIESVCNPDTWYHMAFTREKSTGNLEIYLDGTRVWNVSNWQVGTNALAPYDIIGGDGFTGLIDEVKVYNTVLNAAEVKEAMQGVSYYSFDNIADDTVVIDEWNTRNGQIVDGAAFAKGVKGNALSVTEALKGVIADGVNHLTGNWTVTFWVKENQGLNGEVYMLQNQNPAPQSDRNGYAGTINGGKYAFRVGKDSGDIYTSNDFHATNTWHHIAFTREKSSGRVMMYVDGANKKNEAYDGGNEALAPCDIIGGTGFTGLIDEVKVYNTVLSANEISTMMQDIDSADFTALNAAIANAEALKENEGDYVNFTAVDTALATAKGMLNAKITQQAEVDAAAQSLTDAIEALQLDLRFYGASLVLKDNLSVNFKINRVASTEDGYSDVYVKFEFNGKEFIVENPSEHPSDGRYVFEFSNVAPQCINDTITATLYAKRNGEVVEIESCTYSIAEYCHNTLTRYQADSSQQATELKTLIVDLLNYGSAAQVYTNYKANIPANSMLETEELSWAKAFASVKVTGLKSVTNVKCNESEVADLSVHWSSVALRLNNSVNIRYKIQVTKPEEYENMSVMVTGGNNEPVVIKSDEFVKAEDDFYYVYFDELNAGQMSVPFYATVYVGDKAVSNTLCYSVESYVVAKQNDKDENLVTILSEMIKYGYSANRYAYGK